MKMSAPESDDLAILTQDVLKYLEVMKGPAQIYQPFKMANNRCVMLLGREGLGDRTLMLLKKRDSVKVINRSSVNMTLSWMKDAVVLAASEAPSVLLLTDFEQMALENAEKLPEYVSTLAQRSCPVITMCTVTTLKPFSTELLKNYGVIRLGEMNH